MQAYGSMVTGSDGTIVERAVSGKARLRSYYTQVRDVIKMTHDLDDTDKALIEAHYATDKVLAFTITLNADGSMYTVRYAAAPIYRPIPGNRWQVTVNLVAV